MIENRFSSIIIEWGKDNLRKFSFREKKTPYKVFIAEFLLQRTTASQVEGIFNQLIGKYPTIEDLKKGNSEDFLQYFKAIGLFKRAKQLETASKDIFNEIPNTFEGLKNLSGIGRYTANAIMCFGFGERVPIVDVNVIRIFQRFFNFKSKKKSIETDEKVWDLAKEVLPDEDYVIYNYAILDLPAMICTSKKPFCVKCPLDNECKFSNRMKRLMFFN